MSRLSTVPSSAITLNPSSRTVEITVHRCRSAFTDQILGVIERKRNYFVNVTIGKEKKQTTKRPGGNGPLEWDEKLLFRRVERSSVTFGLYYERTLRRPKLVREFTILLPEMPEPRGQPSPIISRTTLFSDGPQIEFSLDIKDSEDQEVVEQTRVRTDTGGSDIQDMVRHPEVQAQAGEVDTEDRVMSTYINPLRAMGDDDRNEEGEVVSEARQALESQCTIQATWKQVLEGVRVLKEFAGPFSEVHPFAKLACTIFYAITEPFIKQLERDESLRALFGFLVSFCHVIADAKRSELGKKERLSGVLKRASLQITDVAFFVRDYCKNGGFVKKALTHVISGVDDDIQEYCLKLKELKDEFCTRLALETGAGMARTESVVAETRIKVVRVLKAVEDIAHAISLDDITYVPGAGLDTDKLCLDGTRMEILDEIVEWASLNDSESRIMWLCGGAGTGKSAIAHSLAARFEQMGRLGSMFCFSEAEKAARRPASLSPHIARDLADLDANIRHELCKAVQNKADRTTSGITTQFTKLILAPANAIRENLHGPIVIVIDALDESGTVEERRVLLQVLGSKLKELPPNFRIVITSRPDLDIQMELTSEHNLFVKRMHTISAKSTSDDITIFVRKELAKVPSVNEVMCQDLASHARGLFQWAKVACEFVRNSRLGDSAQERYERLTRPLASEAGNHISGDTLLDYLYRAILSKTISSTEKIAMDRFRFVMAWVLTALEPLSCNALNQLFRKSSAIPKNCKAENVVMYLGSLLTGVDDQDAPIRPLHTSFRDFLTDPNRSREFFVRANNSDVHLDMALTCLYTMKAGLRYNICQLPTSHLANKDIPDIETRVSQYIPPSLSYSCRFWAVHLYSIAITESTTPDADAAASAERWNKAIKEIYKLLLNRVLYWLEVLSLLGASNGGLQQVRQVYSLAKTRNVDKECLILIEDLERFWSYFAKCIATSAAHIYVSALPFAPGDSLVARNHMNSNSKTLSIVAGKLQKYPSCLNILHGHTSYIFSVACSSDGTRIVSGSHDRTIRVWNVESGDMVVGPLHGHNDIVISVAFSPDGKRIASGSGDNTIRIWNAETGGMIFSPLKGHTGWVKSVVFSPDGTLIASGSNDSTIRLWSAENGEAVLGSLEGHTDRVRSVAFSPQGTLIVSGSDDMTIRVWNVVNGEMILGPLNGHTDPVWSVTFSSDGTRIASGSGDKNIRIWNVENGDMDLGPLEGHTGSVYSVAFSPDGTRLVSASSDTTIRVWNAKDGQMVLGPLEGHTAYVFSAVFSPDGTRLISGSYDSTVRVWNAEHEQIDLKLLDGHTDIVESTFPSPDGTRIFSASFDTTIRVWSIENGELVLGPLRGHTDGIASAALSPDGKRIASGSADKTIRLWSAETGDMLLGPLEGHTDYVWSVAFSPDGSRIVSGSADKTIRIWNSEDGDLVLGPLEGHTGTLRSVAYSPDGSRIVSGANDGTIRVWNAETGGTIFEPLRGHIAALSPKGTSIVSGSFGTVWVWSAENGKTIWHGPLIGNTSYIDSLTFSRDGTLIASGYDDGTIRLWDAQTGQMVLGPLGGHVGSVISLAFSPDGGQIISGSYDASVRVWNVANIERGAAKVADELSLPSPAVHAAFTQTGSPKNSWRIKDGWALSENDELLFYVPPVHQLALWGPGTELIISRHHTTKLDLSRFVHGARWIECFDSGVESDAA